MAWIKRNLLFVIGGLVALLLLGAAGFYSLTRWQQNSHMREELNKKYEELDRLYKAKPSPGSGKVDNTEEARKQRQEVRNVLAKVDEHFEPIPVIPPFSSSTNAGERISGSEFASALRNTIDQLQRDAVNAGVTLPPRYGFSFEAERALVRFSPGLERLAVQLGEVKVICDVLNKAKVNSIDAIRRERVSADDDKGQQTDYLDEHSQTNELAVLAPYEVSFHSFTPELANALAGFASSSYGLIVKGINVEHAGGTTTFDPSSSPYSAPAAYYPPPSVPRQAEDGVRGPGVGVQPVQNAPAPRGGLQTVLNEKQLRFTLHIEVVKLLPKKN